MKPTGEQLNRAAAEACGWQHAFFPGMTVTMWTQGDDLDTKYRTRRRDAPDYCNDRNALPELLQVITEKGAQYKFGHELCMTMLHYTKELVAQTHTLDVLLAPPRYLVEAALKALGKWQDDWEE